MTDGGRAASDVDELRAEMRSPLKSGASKKTTRFSRSGLPDRQGCEGVRRRSKKIARWLSALVVRLRGLPDPIDLLKPGVDRVSRNERKIVDRVPGRKEFRPDEPVTAL